MKLDDLNNIDFRNAGDLPWPVKLVMLFLALLLVTAAGGWFVWKPMMEELQHAQDEEWGPDKTGGLRATYETKLAQAASLDAYRAQIKDAERKTNALLRQLPDKSQMDGLLTDINQAGIGRGLDFELFKPGGERPAELYAEMPIAIKVMGNYHDLGAFAADVAKMPRIVTLGDLTISAAKETAGKGAPSKLSMDAIAKTYRALDKGEAPAAGKVTGKKGKKGGK
jgi:type IV pilus assembly protein PilO